MKISSFLSIVPKGAKIAACILAGCFAIGLLVAGYINRAHLIVDPGFASIGTSAALFGSIVIAIWILCLGYVYGDARRRAMPPILWTLVAILVPNLLGFLLYFVLRRPITVACANCGQATSVDQRFCSWCGNPRPPAASGGTPSGPGFSGLDSIISA
ncbi:MAG: PLDc N-terminal domain-containing protein [Terracidiphilus sp.]|jgi:hypothetical protein